MCYSFTAYYPKTTFGGVVLGPPGHHLHLRPDRLRRRAPDARRGLGGRRELRRLRSRVDRDCTPGGARPPPGAVDNRSPFSRATPIEIYGSKAGLSPQAVKTLERIYRRRVPVENITTPELTRSLLDASVETGGRWALVHRSGQVDYFVVGDAGKLMLPDIGRLRAAEGRFRGLSPRAHARPRRAAHARRLRRPRPPPARPRRGDPDEPHGRGARRSSTPTTSRPTAAPRSSRTGRWGRCRSGRSRSTSAS